MNMLMGYFNVNSYVGMFQGLLKHMNASLEMSSIPLFSGKGTLEVDLSAVSIRTAT